jgi:hypothetical protein
MGSVPSDDAKDLLDALAATVARRHAREAREKKPRPDGLAYAGGVTQPVTKGGLCRGDSLKQPRTARGPL